MVMGDMICFAKKMTDRYVCIHGHFYQPPRENPWLEAVELQDSAYPYHDWNERIGAECYAPNSASRILDGEGRIAEIVNNYAKISFDMGPTLLAWMERNSPDVYQVVLQADRDSRQIFSGHGSALAQVYNHMIMPLADRRDKETQVIWGVRDFAHRFGRPPEGMWLPETAVDLESLDILAAQGLRFTILAPHQAGRVRPLGSDQWGDVAGGKIDPTMAYAVRLPSGRSFNLFFYDGAISHDVAYGRILGKGEIFVERILSGFADGRGRPEIVNIASDGETYGHHYRFGDMALAYALHFIETESQARLTVYGEFLEKFPPTHEVEIIENTSWSCPHGVERWRSHCGCNSGVRPEWNQAWRAPLRESLDWLRDGIAPDYGDKARLFLKDPDAARNDYIGVVLDRSPERVGSFLDAHVLRPLEEGEKTIVMNLLELQRHAMLMYTSCGWFFDELSGIETLQILQYAGRALQIAGRILGKNLEPRFLELLAKAESNLSENQNGRRIYETYVFPAVVDLEKVCAHYAVSSLFEPYGEKAAVFCYDIERQDYKVTEAGQMKLMAGRARLTSRITLETAVACFGVLHFGGHVLNCGVRAYDGEEAYGRFREEAFASFGKADFPESLRTMDKYFGKSSYSLKSLFRDKQRQFIGLLLKSSMNDVEAAYRQVYQRHAPMILTLRDLGIPEPKALSATAELVLNASFQEAFRSEDPDQEAVKTYLEEARSVGVSLDVETLEFTLRKTIEGIAGALLASPEDTNLLVKLDHAVSLSHLLPFPINLWKVQNVCYRMAKTVYPGILQRTGQGDKGAEEWAGRFKGLCERLSVRVE